MADRANLPPDHTIVHPNRAKTASKVTRAIVIAILLASVGLMMIVTIGGWSKLEGLKPINFAWCIAYLLLAGYVARWSRGALPIAAALAMLLLIVALIAGTGLSGTSWFDRNGYGFAAPRTIFGGKGLSAGTLGYLTLLMVPLQAALILFAMRGFAQGWNVEADAVTGGPEAQVDQWRKSPARPPRRTTAG